MKNKTFKANEPLTASDLNTLLQDSQITQELGNDPALVMSQQAVSELWNDAQTQNKLPRLSGGGYTVRYAERKAFPNDPQVQKGAHYFLNLTDVSARSVDLGFSVEQTYTTSEDGDPSITIRVGADYAGRCLLFRLCPLTHKVKIIQQSHSSEWLKVSETDNAQIALSDVKIRVTRYKTNGYYCYRVFANDQMVTTYTDMQKIAGDAVYYSIGGIGCRPVITDWYCVEDAFLSQELDEMMDKLNSAVVSVVYDRTTKILTLTQLNGVTKSIMLN